MQERSFSSTPSPEFIVCRLFDEDSSDWCVVISHCSFDWYFSNAEQCWTSFHVFVSHLCLLCRNVCLGPFPTFWLSYLSFWYWVVWATCVFWKLILCQLFPLGTYFTYGNIYVSMLLSQFVLPSLSSLCPKSVLYVCVSIPALQIGSSVPFF